MGERYIEVKEAKGEKFTPKEPEEISKPF